MDVVPAALAASNIPEPAPELAALYERYDALALQANSVEVFAIGRAHPERCDPITGCLDVVGEFLRAEEELLGALAARGKAAVAGGRLIFDSRPYNQGYEDLHVDDGRNVAAIDLADVHGLDAGRDRLARAGRSRRHPSPGPTPSCTRRPGSSWT